MQMKLMTTVDAQIDLPAPCDFCEGALTEPLRQKLRAAGLSLTRQRLGLGSLLFLSGDRHATAEMLRAEAEARGLALSAAAIASALRQFVKAGLLREVAFYGSAVWYDTNIGPHCHFYDEDAGQLYDMPENLIPQICLPLYGEIDVIGVDLIVRMRRPQSNTYSPQAMITSSSP